MLVGVFGDFGEEVGFARGFVDGITTVVEGYTKVWCGCRDVCSIPTCRVWIVEW